MSISAEGVFAVLRPASGDGPGQGETGVEGTKIARNPIPQEALIP
jgi:hypothetical protein